MSYISGNISRYLSFICNSRFFWKMHIKSFRILFEKVVNKHRKFQIPRKCSLKMSKHLLLPCLSHRSEGDEFLLDEFVVIDAPNPSSKSFEYGKGAYVCENPESANKQEQSVRTMYRLILVI